MLKSLLSVTSLAGKYEDMILGRRVDEVSQQLLECVDDDAKLSCDQERRLLMNEWADKNAVDYYRQSHLVMAMTCERKSMASLVERVGALAVTWPGLATTFSPLSLDAESRESALNDGFHSAVSIPGLFCKQAAETSAIPVAARVLRCASLTPSDREVSDLIWAEAVKPFDTRSGPLLRALIIDGGASEMLLAIVVDRLVADWPSLARIHAFLDSELGPPVDHEPARPGPHRADRRRRRGTEDSLWRVIRYWSDLKSPPLMWDDFPCAKPITAVPGTRQDFRSVELSHAAGANLLAMSGALGIEVGALLMTGFFLALYHLTQRRMVNVWTEYRPSEQAASRRVGPYSHAHLLSVDFAGVRTTDDAINRVVSALSETREHSAVPLEAAWRCLGSNLMPRTGQVWCQHISVGRDRLKSPGTLVRTWPLLDTDSFATLQLRSCDDGRVLSLSAAYTTSFMSARAVDEVLEDAAFILAVMGNGRTNGSDLTRLDPVSTGAGRDHMPKNLASPPSECIVCGSRRGDRSH